MLKLLLKLRDAFHFAVDSFWAGIIKSNLGACGKNVMIKPSTSVFKGLENIYLSDDVRIARYAVIYSTVAKCIIGPKVGIAPHFTVITGNHRSDVIGHFVFDNDIPKIPENDKDVIIEGDTWIGINVTILSGVRVGRGSMIAAGAVLTKSFPPYSIIGGVPAKILKYRFTIDECLEHEHKLYTEEKRYTREQLEMSRKSQQSC